jgi:hypothetical protein
MLLNMIIWKAAIPLAATMLEDRTAVGFSLSCYLLAGQLGSFAKLF